MAKPNTLTTANTFSHIVQTINDIINDYTSLSVLGSEFVRNDIEQTLTNDFTLQGQWEFQTPIDVFDYNGNIISLAGQGSGENHTGFQIIDPNSTGAQESFSVRNGNLVEVVVVSENSATFTGELYANTNQQVWHTGNFTPSDYDTSSEVDTKITNNTYKEWEATRAVAAGMSVGWDMQLQDDDGSAATDPGKPDVAMYSKGTERVKVSFAYTVNDLVDYADYEYSSDSGSTYGTKHRQTFTYDVNDFVTDINWSTV